MIDSFKKMYLSYFYQQKQVIYHAYTLSIFSVALGEITHLKA